MTFFIVPEQGKRENILFVFKKTQFHQNKSQK